MRFFLIVASLVASIVANANPQGKITGQVRGPDGNPMPQAIVTLQNMEETVTLQKTASTNKGFYSFSNVANGYYVVTAYKDGFQEDREVVYPSERKTPSFMEGR